MNFGVTIGISFPDPAARAFSFRTHGLPHKYIGTTGVVVVSVLTSAVHHMVTGTRTYVVLFAVRDDVVCL